jgi:peptide/nickel transport system permease protein
LFQALITFILFMVVLFIATRAAGDPAVLILPADATPEMIQSVRERIGTDRTYLEQFGVFLRDMATFNFGRSIVYREPVLDLIGARIAASMKLQLASLGLILLTAFPLGILAASRRGLWPDHLVRFIAAFGQAAPSFWVGLLLMALFSVKLGWLPAGGMGDGGMDSLLHYILPTLTTSLFLFASLTRLLRSSMLETLDAEFVKLARAKGVSEAKVIWVHVLRNALLPIMTFMAIWIGTAISGSVVVEVVFDWPGVGSMFVDSIAMRDFPMIQAIVGLVAVSVIGANLIVDLLCLKDPRLGNFQSFIPRDWVEGTSLSDPDFSEKAPHTSVEIYHHFSLVLLHNGEGSQKSAGRKILGHYQSIGGLIQIDAVMENFEAHDFSRQTRRRGS